jgi:hypothetical protein
LQIKTHRAISYSSFEHDGLGRYGDPLNPDGDIRAMEEAHRFLEQNGILFLGVPLGQDCIVWNLHRIYGKNRLPRLLKGYKLIDVFDVNDIDPFSRPSGHGKQNTLVLQKIESDFPEDGYLCGIIPGDNTKFQAVDLLNRINSMIYEYKKMESRLNR